MPGISAENREAAGAKAGDKIEVDLEADLEIREVRIPPDLMKALNDKPEAIRSFGGLSYSHKLEHVLHVEQAKTAATRERRILKVISMMRKGRTE